MMQAARNMLARARGLLAPTGTALAHQVAHLRTRLDKATPQLPTWGLIAIAAVIGVLGGLYAVLFRWMIRIAGELFRGYAGSGLAWLHPSLIFIVPALGGLVVGPLTYFLAREAKGHGVPEVIDAVLLKGGRMRLRVLAIKGIASATTMGSGGSAGREGPIVQMGSALGSVLAQALRLKDAPTRIFVACGAAAGISATYNAPIAGAMFALEIILANFTTSSFSLIIVSSVAAAAVSQSLLGNHPAITATVQFSLVHPEELLNYAVLGLVAGLAGVTFIKLLYGAEDRFDLLRAVPPYLRPAIGGLAVGLMGLAAPGILGVGYGTIDRILLGGLPLALTLMLFVGKILATSLTLGSGGSGGVFAPSLVTGAALGGSLGLVAHGLMPTLTAAPAAYALVGMAALVAATTQAPITAVIILFEMTRDYSVILPVLVAVAIATTISARLTHGTIYTTKLYRRGVNVQALRSTDLLQRRVVGDVMTRHVHHVAAEGTLRDVVAQMQAVRHTGYPVIDRDGALVGVITLQDVRNCCPDDPERRLATAVSEVMSAPPLTATADESLADALARMTTNGIGRLPVVAAEERSRVVGWVSRTDIVAAHQQREPA